jgi:hypothetical protein
MVNDERFDQPDKVSVSSVSPSPMPTIPLWCLSQACPSPSQLSAQPNNQLTNACYLTLARAIRRCSSNIHSASFGTLRFMAAGGIARTLLRALAYRHLCWDESDTESDLTRRTTDMNQPIKELESGRSTPLPHCTHDHNTHGPTPSPPVLLRAVRVPSTS